MGCEEDFGTGEERGEVGEEVGVEVSVEGLDEGGEVGGLVRHLLEGRNRQTAVDGADAACENVNIYASFN